MMLEEALEQEQVNFSMFSQRTEETQNKEQNASDFHGTNMSESRDCLHWSRNRSLRCSMPCLLLVSCILLRVSQGFVSIVHQNSFGVSRNLNARCRQSSTPLCAIKTKLPAAEVISTDSSPLLTVRPGPGVTITSASDNTVVIFNSEGDDKNEDDSNVPQARDESDEEEEESPQETSDTKMDRRTAAATAALLRLSKKGTGGPSRRGKKQRNTSVGARRVGSATKARRQGVGAASQILGTVRTTAAAAAAKRESENKNATSTEPSDKADESPSNRGSQGLSRSVIQSTINDLLENQQPNTMTDGDQGINGPSAALGATMGVLGEPEIGPKHSFFQEPLPGTVLVRPSSSANDISSVRFRSDFMSVRVATPSDDVDIANLRLSVFSDFSAEVRKHFCYRSCQVLASRRLRGATCLAATVPRDNAECFQRADYVLGSVECSVHEFHGTKLGMHRPPESLLYITEVAVSPRARRCGVGSKLLQGVDKLAELRNVETLYLHVDVKNVAALNLYEKAGYRPVETRDPLFDEFTTSLNLHDGATKGRNHFLLHKHMTASPTWLPLQEPSCTYGVNTLGFDVLA